MDVRLAIHDSLTAHGARRVDDCEGPYVLGWFHWGGNDRTLAVRERDGLVESLCGLWLSDNLAAQHDAAVAMAIEVLNQVPWGRWTLLRDHRLVVFRVATRIPRAETDLPVRVDHLVKTSVIEAKRGLWLFEDLNSGTGVDRLLLLVQSLNRQPACEQLSTDEQVTSQQWRALVERILAEA